MKVMVIGPTGLVGQALLRELFADPRIEHIQVFHRRAVELEHPKMHWEVVDFDQPEHWADAIQADVLFNAMGTTIKRAGSRSKQHTIDVTYPFEVARAARRNGCATIINVSATGAEASSKVFYNHLKGELETALQSLDFEQVHHMRPSLLTGNREEFRLGERLAEPMMNILKWVPGMRKYRPISGQEVAKAMLYLALSYKEKGVFVHELDRIHALAQKLPSVD